jgi:hypothetical protein
MISSYLDDDAFVEFVLEKGSIPFVVRGSISCLANFNFSPFIMVYRHDSHQSKTKSSCFDRDKRE